MKRKGWLFMITAATVTVLAGAAAASSALGVPETDPALASFRLRTVSQTGTQCQGVDGQYFQGSSTLRGSIIASDPQLTGSMQVISNDLVNMDTGLGTSSGTFTVKDPNSGQILATGSFQLVDSATSLRGLVTADLGNGRTLVAAASLMSDPVTETTRGEFGASRPPVRADLAVIQSGSC